MKEAIIKKKQQKKKKGVVKYCHKCGSVLEVRLVRPDITVPFHMHLKFIPCFNLNTGKEQFLKMYRCPNICVLHLTNHRWYIDYDDIVTEDQSRKLSAKGG